MAIWEETTGKSGIEIKCERSVRTDSFNTTDIPNMAPKKRGLLSKLVLLMALASSATVGLLGWNWLNGLVCHNVSVSGNVHADVREVMSAARVDTGGALFGIDAVLIADRVERHPWVKNARITRLPPSTLSIHIEERVPVMLVIDADGVPSAYLDADGYSMPVTAHSTFDLPLIAGVKLPTNPNEAVKSRSVRELVRTVAAIDLVVDVLISSFVVEANGQIGLRSVPVNGQGSIVVRLGRRDFDEKLGRLYAFWHQAVITRPGHRYDFIDLRFDSQIVTKERTET